MYYWCTTHRQKTVWSRFHVGTRPVASPRLTDFFTRDSEPPLARVCLTNRLLRRLAKTLLSPLNVLPAQPWRPVSHFIHGRYHSFTFVDLGCPNRAFSANPLSISRVEGRWHVSRPNKLQPRTTTAGRMCPPRGLRRPCVCLFFFLSTILVCPAPPWPLPLPPGYPRASQQSGHHSPKFTWGFPNGVMWT